MYHDNIYNIENKHKKKYLTTYESCKKELSILDKDLPIIKKEQNLPEPKLVKAITKLEKRNVKICYKNILSMVFVIAIFLFLIYIFWYYNNSKTQY